MAEGERVQRQKWLARGVTVFVVLSVDEDFREWREREGVETPTESSVLHPAGPPCGPPGGDDGQSRRMKEGQITDCCAGRSTARGASFAISGLAIALDRDAAGAVQKVRTADGQTVFADGITHWPANEPCPVPLVFAMLFQILSPRFVTGRGSTS